MDRLHDSAWQYVAEVLHAADLPMVAAHALVDGHDSPALRELAGLSRRSDAAEVRELYVQALDELGVYLPDEETAGRRLLVSLAIGLAQGKLSPKGVADQLSMTVAAHTQEETQFLSIAADYSEWVEPDVLPGWGHDLQTAARALAASTDLAPASSYQVCGVTDQPT
ncbi:hypothetical protein OG987_17455 [Streptomyces sp. NBC_01620]|uniref:hypothetical protein n=1 Tax=Streptomyces sp. NBC_01620 TaxID=2975902 RepID=UPI00386CA520|nr:hypothetical protein OG987_17455 [Streptomyces sp. NBC_01620]